MEINISQIDSITIAEILSERVEINDAQDALDLMANCSYQGANCIIINEENLTPDFFDLKTRLAGDILQKFSNYNMKLAIVGNFSKFTSKSLKDFIFESNKIGRIIFVGNKVDVLKRFTKQ